MVRVQEDRKAEHEVLGTENVGFETQTSIELRCQLVVDNSSSEGDRQKRKHSTHHETADAFGGCGRRFVIVAACFGLLVLNFPHEQQVLQAVERRNEDHQNVVGIREH